MGRLKEEILMAKANFNLTRFIATVGVESFARTNRFEVLIAPPPGLRNFRYGELVSLYVEQASFPLLNIATKQQKIFGPTYQRPITSEYGGEGISLTFNVDSSMEVKKFFEDWMHIIVDPVTFEVNYQSEYITKILLRQLDEQENVTHEIELLEAFPRNMNIMELNNAATNQTHRLNILFAYRYWRNPERVNPVAIPRAVITPEIPRADFRVPEIRDQFNWQTGQLSSEPGSDLPPSP